MIINHQPTAFEIEEMLECVSQTYDLDEYFPVPNGESRVEWLLNSWTYLFYDDDGNPLAYIVFSFTNKNMRYAYFGFMTTRFCRTSHILRIHRICNKLFRSVFSRGLRVYILNDKMLRKCKNLKFTQSQTNKNVYFRRF